MFFKPDVLCRKRVRMVHGGGGDKDFSVKKEQGNDFRDPFSLD
jgi:hypothetical protein